MFPGLRRFRTNEVIGAVWSEFDLEPEKLIDLGATVSAIKCADVDEDLLTALDRIDKSETAFVIPARQLAFETHDGR